MRSAHVLLLCANRGHAISVTTICDDDQFYYLIEVMSIRLLNSKLLFPFKIKKKNCVANTVRLCNYPSPCRIFESLIFKNCAFMNSQTMECTPTYHCDAQLIPESAGCGLFSSWLLCPPNMFPSFFKNLPSFPHKMFKTHILFSPTPPWNHPFHQEALVSFGYLKANTQVLNVLSAPGVSQAQDLTEDRAGSVYTHPPTHQHTSTSVYSPVCPS